MVTKPTYEELEAKVKYLESELAKRKAKDKEIIQVLSEDFQRLADRSQDAIYHFDIDSRSFPFFNKLFLELYGIEKRGQKSLSPKSVSVHIHPDDIDQVKAAKTASLEKGNTTGEINYRFLHPNGSTHWMHDRWTVIRDSEDQPLAIEGFIRDITRNKQAEHDRRARERMQGVLEMAGAVCHELNNPMQVILVCCEKLIKDFSPSDPLHQNLLDLLKKNIDRMNKITIRINRITKYATKDYVQGKKIIDIDEASST